MTNKIKILVAEDSAVQLNIFTNALREAGFEVIPVGAGPQIYREAVSNHPDLVLLDIMMPEIDGIEICRNLKRAPNTKDILIVIHSSKADADMMDLAHAAGADGYIIKFNDPGKLVERTREILREKLGKEL